MQGDTHLLWECPQVALGFKSGAWFPSTWGQTTGWGRRMFSIINRVRRNGWCKPWTWTGQRCARGATKQAGYFHYHSVCTSARYCPATWRSSSVKTTSLCPGHCFLAPFMSSFFSSSSLPSLDSLSQLHISAPGDLQSTCPRVGLLDHGENMACFYKKWWACGLKLCSTFPLADGDAPHG